MEEKAYNAVSFTWDIKNEARVSGCRSLFVLQRCTTVENKERDKSQELSYETVGMKTRQQGETFAMRTKMTHSLRAFLFVWVRRF